MQASRRERSGAVQRGNCTELPCLQARVKVALHLERIAMMSARPQRDNAAYMVRVDCALHGKRHLKCASEPGALLLLVMHFRNG